MKSITFAHLATLGNEEIAELTDSPEGFVIIADPPIKAAIVAFLENERNYSLGRKRLRDRLAYLWGGRFGFSIIPFITVWNRARINGLEIKAISEMESKFHFRFGKLGN